MFYVGQKVVCVNDDWRLPFSWGRVLNTLRYGRDRDPRIRETYTIRTIKQKHDSVWFRFDELRNPESDDFAECEYRSDCFRPLVKRKTDISVFQEMLRPVTEPVTV